MDGIFSDCTSLERITLGKWKYDNYSGYSDKPYFPIAMYDVSNKCKRYSADEDIPENTNHTFVAAKKLQPAKVKLTGLKAGKKTMTVKWKRVSKKNRKKIRNNRKNPKNRKNRKNPKGLPHRMRRLRAPETSWVSRRRGLKSRQPNRRAMPASVGGAYGRSGKQFNAAAFSRPVECLTPEVAGKGRGTEVRGLGKRFGRIDPVDAEP